MMSYLTALTKDSFGQKEFKIQTDKDDLKFDIANQKKTIRQKGLELDSIERAKIAAKEVRKRARKAPKAAVDLDDNDADAVLVRQEIDHALYEIQTSHVPVAKKVMETKKWSSRPGHWHDIVNHMKTHGYASVCREYAADLADLKIESRKATLNRWIRDMSNAKVIASNKDRLPAYGSDVEKDLVSDVATRNELGLLVDNHVLRELLINKLVETNQTNLLLENGGRHVYRYGWAQRFWKRNGFVSRLATSKMRDPPADLEEKKETMIRIGAVHIYKGQIPEKLVYALDETNALFLASKNRTMTKRGKRRIRLLGKGSDKAQITVTICITEAGDVLPVQYIFGGKTDRCHPKTILPKGSLFCHSTSHWQTEETFIQYIKGVLIPHKKETIRSLGLPESQVSLLKLDLHYSHKTDKVLKLLEENNFKLLYVPARCTDEFQECDTVINKPFKSGMKAAFRDYIHEEFNKYKGNPSEWSIKITMGRLKEHIVRFVETGMNAVRTDEFSSIIRNAFKTHGHFADMRSVERQLIAATDNLSLDVSEFEEENNKVFIMDEVDNEGEMLSVLGENDSSDDSSQDGSDDGINRMKLTMAVKDHGLQAKTIFEEPTRLEKFNNVVPAPTSTSVIQTTPAPKRRRLAAIKKPKLMKSSLKNDGIIAKQISNSATVSVGGILFSSPAPSRPVNTVTPKLTDTVTAEQRVLLNMRYVALSDEDEERVHDVLYGNRPEDDLIREHFAIPMTVKKLRTLKSSKWIVDDVSTLLYMT